MAWAMATRCRWPPDSLRPRSPTTVSYRSGRRIDELLDVGGLAHRVHDVVVHDRPSLARSVAVVLGAHAVADVLGDGPVQELGILGNIGDVAAQRGQGDLR